MRMRLIPVICLAVLAAAPAAAQAKVPESVSCTAASATVLFWPKGHKSVPSVKFPSIKTPHLEVYKPGAAYPSVNFLLYADATRFVDPSRACGIGRVGKTRGVRNAKTITVKKAVTCSAAANLTYDVVRGKKGLVVIGHAGPDAYFRATIKSKGSSLTYDRQACRVASAPH
jgi:hypothetical protein